MSRAAKRGLESSDVGVYAHDFGRNIFGMRNFLFSILIYISGISIYTALTNAEYLYCTFIFHFEFLFFTLCYM